MRSPVIVEHHGDLGGFDTELLTRTTWRCCPATTDWPAAPPWCRPASTAIR
ncbi:hypothetical protein AB0B45_20685 [Nonomuraea sp. NPDC049152]|uniref:hypothetical protein n=1 Tax=Nonomuraea sp. NPDC049152 TaxID=3154350 RepID=UPI0033BFF325